MTFRTSARPLTPIIVLAHALLSCGGDSSGDAANVGDAADAAAEMTDATADGGGCAEVTFDATDPRLPCDVGAVIAVKCQRCHNVDAVVAVCTADLSCLPAPFPLLSWEDTRQEYGGTYVFERMREVISSGFMPLQDSRIEPPVEPLTESEKELLLGWLGRCAPPADGVECPMPEAGAAAPAP